MRRKAAVHFMMLFGITVIILLSLLLVRLLAHVYTADVPEIGAAQEAVLDGVQRMDAIILYANLSARKAVNEEAGRPHTGELKNRVADRFNQYMASHPFEHLPTSFSAEQQGNTIFLTTSEQTIIVLGQSGKAQPLLAGLGGSGMLEIWPVQGEMIVTSLFGKRSGGEGSVNHPALDIYAPFGAPVYAVADGAVTVHATTSGHEYLSQQLANGWVCEYYHVKHINTLVSGASVSRAEQIAVIADEGLGAHVDLRCYQPELLTKERVITVFGQEHVSSSDTQSSQMALAVYESTETRVYIDPYCLFSDALQMQMRKAINTRAQQNPSSLTGLDFRDGESVDAKLGATCQAYGEKGIFSAGIPVNAQQAWVDLVIENTLGHEGGRNTATQNVDRGGATNFGITLQTLRDYRNDQSLTAKDIDALTREEAIAIYKQNYFFGPGVDKFPVAIMPLLFDMAVNHGPRNAFGILQNALRREEIGYSDTPRTKAGDTQTVAMTEKALAEFGTEKVINAIVDERLDFYQAIIDEDSSQGIFLKGWKTRANAFRKLDILSSSGTYVQGSGVQNTIRFLLSTSTPVTDEQLAAEKDIQTMKINLENCHADDHACIAGALRTAPFSPAPQACEEYVLQLQEALRSCKIQSLVRVETCGCAIPSPTNVPGLVEMNLSENMITFVFEEEGKRRTEIISSDWFSQGEDSISNKPVRLGIARTPSELSHVQDTLMWKKQAKTLLFDDTTSIPIASDWLWMSMRDMYVGNLYQGRTIIFSQSVDSACQTRTPRMYCADEDTFMVRHLPPSPNPLSRASSSLTQPVSEGVLGAPVSFEDMLQ